jgi:hypothetical protein
VTLLVHQPHFHVPGGPAHRRDDVLEIIDRRRRRGDQGGGLGQPVPVGDDIWLDLVAHAAQQFRRRECRRGHHDPQGREVVTSRGVENRLEDGRRAKQDRDALGLDRAHDVLHVEHGLGEDRHSVHDARHPAGLVAERVEERRDDEIAVARAEVHQLRIPAVCPQRLGVGEAHALGVAGRLAESLVTALGEMVASECTDASAHSRALRAIEGGDAHGATRIWRSHQGG